MRGTEFGPNRVEDSLDRTERILSQLQQAGFSQEDLLTCLDIVCYEVQQIPNKESLPPEKEKALKSLNHTLRLTDAIKNPETTAEAIGHAIQILLSQGVSEEDLTPEHFREILSILNEDDEVVHQKVEEMLAAADIDIQKFGKMATSPEFEKFLAQREKEIAEQDEKFKRGER